MDTFCSLFCEHILLLNNTTHMINYPKCIKFYYQIWLYIISFSIIEVYSTMSRLLKIRFYRNIIIHLDLLVNHNKYSQIYISCKKFNSSGFCWHKKSLCSRPKFNRFENIIYLIVKFISSCFWHVLKTNNTLSLFKVIR